MHPDWGTLVIRREGDGLVGELGVVRARLEVFEGPHLRAELTLDQGTVLRFEFATDGRATAFTAQGVRWERR